jgi:excisionase family DNA binding protein
MAKPRTTPTRRKPTTSPPDRTGTGRLLTVPEVAERLGTSERFPRRLIAERRIDYVKVGNHVRIPEDMVEDFIAAGTVKAAE